ncbi:MAG: anti-sigma F factor [Clostridia bacterium]|nr:anti-sigma F factor [Clostridia bacterium]
MIQHNEMEISFLSIAENESFARVVIAAFAVQLSPTVSEIADIKTAVSEAVTNAIVHGYEGKTGMVRLRANIEDRMLTIEISDQGRGIANVKQAMEPFFTTHPEQERSGMGFAVMQTFMDDLHVASSPGQGTTIRMRKRIRSGSPQGMTGTYGMGGML